MAKAGAKKGGKPAAGKAPPVSTLPPPEPVKAKRAPRKKAAAPVDPFADWDPERVARECREAVEAKARKARGPIVVPEGAMPMPGTRRPRKGGGPVKVVVTEEPGPHGGRLKRSRAVPVEPKLADKAERKPSVEMTDAIFLSICFRISEGEPLRQICRRHDMPSKSAFHRYLDGEDLGDADGADDAVSGRIARYARARKFGFDDIAEEALEIADDGSNDWIEREHEDGSTSVDLDREHVARSKLRVDTRLKLLSKWDPKGYGDRLALSDPDGKPIGGGAKSTSDLAIEIAKLMVAAKQEKGEG